MTLEPVCAVGLMLEAGAGARTRNCAIVRIALTGGTVAWIDVLSAVIILFEIVSNDQTLVGRSLYIHLS
jgi:hypothetical protein